MRTTLEQMVALPLPPTEGSGCPTERDALIYLVDAMKDMAYAAVNGGAERVRTL